MKSLFYKSKMIFVIFMAVSMLFTLIGVSFITHNKTMKPLPSLSDHFTVFTIYKADGLTTDDLVKSIKEQSGNKGFFCAKYYSSEDGYSVLYNTDSLFKMDLKAGRGFSQKDFASEDDIAVVNADKADETKRMIKRKHIIISNNKYKIVGECIEKKNLNSTSWYIPMTANKQKSERLYGYYIFDTGNANGYKIAKEIKENIIKKSPNASVTVAKGLSDEGRQMKQTTANYSSMLKFLVLTVVLVLLNSFSACVFWLEAKKKEIAVRKMLGATNKKIRQWLINELLVILIISFAAGAALSQIFLLISLKLPVADSVTMMFGNYISWQGTLIGFALLMIIGLINIFVMLKIYNKKVIAGGLKNE